jgi:acid phosphatase class B
MIGAAKIYYGDADQDIRQAQEVGARPITVVRASNMTYSVRSRIERLQSLDAM